MSFASQFRSTCAVAAVSAAGWHSLIAQAPAESAAPNVVRFTLGAGVMTAPKYDGSDEYRVTPLPLASLDIGDKVFVGFGAAGVYLVKERGFTGTFGIAISPSRSSRGAEALAGTDKHSLGAHSVSSVGYRNGWISAGITGSRSLRERGGYNLRGDFGVTLPVTQRFSIGMMMNVEFADRRSMTWDFGVSQREAQRRAELVAGGDDRLRPDEARAYRPGAGLRSAGAGASLGYQVTNRWGVIGMVELSRLGNQAAGSPLVRRRNGVTAGLGITFLP